MAGYKRELPKGITKAELAGILATWIYLKNDTDNGIMPDVEMTDIREDGEFRDKWFHIGNADYCLTSENGENEHLADIIDIYDADGEIDEGWTTDDIRVTIY